MIIFDIGLIMPELAHLAESLAHTMNLKNENSSDEKTIDAAIELIRDPHSIEKQTAYTDSISH